jgi:hypothetical protein
MDTRKLILPAVALVGGALLGRLIGLKGLMRAGMAALTVANVSETAGLLTAGKRAPQRKAVQKTARQKMARKRSAQRKSAPRKQTHANSASAHTH